MEKSKIVIQFQATIEFHMSLEDFQTINEFIDHGYPEMVRYGQHGQFWYGVKSRVGWAVEHKRPLQTETFSFRDIDILLKALKPRQCKPKLRKHAQKLSDMFWDVLKVANEQTGKAIETYSQTIYLEKGYPEEVNGTIATFTKQDFEDWMTSKGWAKDIKALHRKAFRGRILFEDDGYFEHID